MKSILYIHGMGGGADSRIPSILAEALVGRVDVCVRTYDFDPEIAWGQICSWVEEVKPDLVIGESLGSLHAMRIRKVPLLFVSPALNAPLYFELMAWLTLIPGMTLLFDRIYRPREGDRQNLHFTYRTLRKYRSYRKAAIQTATSQHKDRSFHAFFGNADHYRKTGVVSLKTWTKYFGDSYCLYEGTHFMEDIPIAEDLIPAICNILNIK